VAVEKFKPAKQIEDYYLVVSRLNPYKRIDLAVKACSKMGVKLKVAGTGPYRKYLESIAGNTVEFLGRVSDAQLALLYSKAKALIFPGEEDFGIVPVECQASGRPVIAFRGDGALETVQENITGMFFDTPTVESLMLLLEKFEKMNFHSDAIVKNSRQFSKSLFKEKMYAFIDEKKKKARSVFA
jgi:glycosyltransferase involved in cell wall biosynthesis